MEAAHSPSHPPVIGRSHGHGIPLWGLFLALLLLTAAEVGLFEVWSRSNETGHPFMPKFAMVLLLFAFTLPKAAIVMVFFMHLKFEKQLIIMFALIPFVTAAIAILVPTTDNQTLRSDHKMNNFDSNLKAFSPNTAHEHGGEHEAAPESGEKPAHAE